MIRVALAVALAVAHALAWARTPPEALAGYVLASHLAAKLAAGGACLAAALALTRGDWMRRFWLSLGASYLLLAAAEDPIVVRIAGAAGAPIAAAVLLVAGNLLSVLASAMLASTWRRAGLRGTATWGRTGLHGLAVAGALALVGPALAREISSALADGGFPAWASAASYLCDAATFVLLVPVVQFALRLGGSRLARPWWTFAASTAGWLLFDAAERFPALFPGPEGAAGEALRTAATLLTVAAASYQRGLVLEARARLAAADPAPASASATPPA